MLSFVFICVTKMAGKKKANNKKSKKTLSNDDFFEVEEILEKRIQKRQVFKKNIHHIRVANGKIHFKIQYLVKWAGYDDVYNTWEPIKHLNENALDALNAFEKKEKQKQQQQSKIEKRMKQKGEKSKQLVRTKEIPAIGDFCFAKVRGYAPWPAVVDKIEKPIVWVKFFNSNQRYCIFIGHFLFVYTAIVIFYSGKCTVNTVTNLDDGYVYINQHKSNSGFTKAVKEMAFVIKERGKEMKIPSNFLKKYENLI